MFMKGKFTFLEKPLSFSLEQTHVQNSELRTVQCAEFCSLLVASRYLFH